jgi:hypothetical protein
MAKKPSTQARSFRFKVLQPDPASCPQTIPRLFDTTQESAGHVRDGI